MRDEITYARRTMEAVVAEAQRLYHMSLSVEDAVTQAEWGEFGSLSFTDSGAPLVVRRVFDELDGKLPVGR